ncbi:MAG: response regulator [Chitinivibrionales bacterium]|nr:response regulator [Chitinivibrionales bacterium]
MEHKGRLLVVDDETSLRLLLSKELAREGYDTEAVSGGEQALARLREETYNVVLLDIVMPGMDGLSVLRQIRDSGHSAEVIMLTGNATVENAIQCMKLGAFEYVRKPYQLAELLIHIERAIKHQRSQLGIEILKEELRRSGQRTALIGSSRAMEKLRGMVSKVARTQSTALIQGESGAGKEVVARSIHELSHRANMQFVAVNCASFSETLLESELFGHEKGAFTDAKSQKRGLAEIADGGTLFLDEVGEIPMHFQAKLLRFLETGEIRRVGGTRDIRLDVRILCATNRSLEELIQRREFREDLYYRLNVLSLTVPPLRDHPGDIPALVNNFLAQLGFNKRFDDGALALLSSYPWPGNARELKNVVERACIMSSSATITAADIGFLRNTPNGRPTAVPEPAPGSDAGTAPTPTMSLQEVEREHIVRVLGYVKGHKTRAAELLGVRPKTLYNKIKVYGIKQSFE